MRSCTCATQAPSCNIPRYNAFSARCQKKKKRPAACIEGKNFRVRLRDLIYCDRTRVERTPKRANWVAKNKWCWINLFFCNYSIKGSRITSFFSFVHWTIAWILTNLALTWIKKRPKYNRRVFSNFDMFKQLPSEKFCSRNDFRENTLKMTCTYFNLSWFTDKVIYLPFFFFEN